MALHGHVLCRYDNFSHWGLVARTVLQNDRYPNFADTLIDFQQYPLGSTTFIYYFSKIVSNAEYIQMLAQSYLMLCFLIPIFKYVKKHWSIVFTYMLLFINFIFCYCIWPTSLCVDTLLPLQGMAVLLFLYSECLFNEKKEKMFLFYIRFLFYVRLCKSKILEYIS